MIAVAFTFPTTDRVSLLPPQVPIPSLNPKSPSPPPPSYLSDCTTVPYVVRYSGYSCEYCTVPVYEYGTVLYSYEYESWQQQDIKYSTYSQPQSSGAYRTLPRIRELRLPRFTSGAEIACNHSNHKCASIASNINISRHQSRHQSPKNTLK